MTLMRQFELTTGTTRPHQMVCWLPEDSRLRVGTRLTVKETGARMWTVSARYQTVEWLERLVAGRRWAVGGLSYR